MELALCKNCGLRTSKLPDGRWLHSTHNCGGETVSFDAPILNRYRDLCFQNSKDHGFHDDAGKTVGDDIALMHSELSEALEDFRAGHKPNELWYEHKDSLNPRLDVWDGTSLKPMPAKPCGIPSEMADVLIRIFDFCGKFGIDIQRAVDEKMAYNVTRPHRHGSKTL